LAYIHIIRDKLEPCEGLKPSQGYPSEHYNETSDLSKST